jgi:glycosyltransferase involved in cell wall biosynthesis
VVATIGIDARAAAEVPAGRGRFVRELLAALARRDDDLQYRLYARDPWGDLDPERFTWVRVGHRDPLWHVAVARRAARETDAFLSTNSYLTAALSRAPMAVMVYDLVPFVAADLARSRSTWIERATIRPAVRRSSSLICISTATEQDLVQCFPRAHGKTAVAHLAADPAFSEARDQILGAEKAPFVLAVGTLEPRKNLRRLIEAWETVAEHHARSHRLLLVGPEGWGDPGLERVASTASIEQTGYVTDAELRRLYATCACFVYPSLYEGFGLPILEAMAAGAPVVTSNLSSMPEVAGDAALLVDPTNPREIGTAIVRVLDDPALGDELRRRGHVRAAAFSWDRTAAQVLDAVLAGSRT